MNRKYSLSQNSQSTVESIVNIADNRDEVIESIAFTLLKLVTDNKTKKNYKEKVKSQEKSPFTSKNIPSISISDYLNRIKKYTNIEESSLIYSLIIMDKFLKSKLIYLTENNLHRLFLTSTVVSIKLNEDHYFTNKYYAKVGGMDLKSLNLLETKFLRALDYDLFVDFKLFEKYYRNIMSFEKSL